MQTAEAKPGGYPRDPRALALDLAGLLDRKKAAGISILDVSGPIVIADYFVIATAQNPRHAQALGRELETTMKRAGLRRRNVAGLEGENRWILLDFDDVVVHVFLPESRAFYALEDLWADVPRVPFEPPDPAPDRGSGSSSAEIRPSPTSDDSTASTGRPMKDVETP